MRRQTSSNNTNTISMCSTPYIVHAVAEDVARRGRRVVALELLRRGNGTGHKGGGGEQGKQRHVQHKMLEPQHSDSTFVCLKNIKTHNTNTSRSRVSAIDSINQ